MSSDWDAITAAYDELDAAQARVAEFSYDALTVRELLVLVGRRETMHCRQAAVDHQLITRLSAEATPIEWGAKNLADLLAIRLRISKGEARRRVDEAAELGPRTALTGETLTPNLANLAQAQAAGQVNGEHVRIIRRFFAELPGFVDYQTRESAEATLAAIARDHTPAELRQAAERLSALLNPDGNYSDAERARRRHLTIGKQASDGMSPINGLLDPQARATLNAVLAKLAAPGMCNPDDETPCISGTPSEAGIQRDTRSAGQRNHDALTAMGRSLLASGELGQHNGLPTSIIVTTSLKELESGCGQAITGGGTQLPMPDVIRMASHAYHYLVVFDRHTEIPLYLGRSRRFASAGQRIVLHAKDRGCTHPGCTVPGYWCQVHHAIDDWADGGQTNIVDLTLACGCHNRFVKEDGWRTRKRKDGRTEWIPPPHLDWGHLPLAGDGQPRVNDYHHPENLLRADEDDQDDEKS